MSLPRDRQARQFGAASLIVVMILFFVISMVAAYTNRNLIFEQKTSVNQSRSTRALEAAEAGVEWALTQLNSGRIDDTCNASANVANPTFRQRFLDIDPDTGNITPRKRGDGVTDHYPTCVYNGAAWVCSCPVDADPVLGPPAGGDIFPAFRVRFRRVCDLATAPDTACAEPVRPGVVHIDVNACTTLSESCLRFAPAPTSVPGEGRVTVHVVAGLKGALPSSPLGALTARGNVAAGAGLTLTNAEELGHGVTVHAGGTYSLASAAVLQGRAGATSESTLRDGDTTLGAAGMTPDRYFAALLGLWRTTFAEQPAAIAVDCAVSCSAATLRDKVRLNPGRLFWVIGDLDFDSPGDIGSAASPVFLNVTGNVTFSSAVSVFGAVYSQAADWAAAGAGAGSIFGAAIAEGNFTSTASDLSIVYNLDVIKRLRTQTGSFVRVPGTWKDFDT